MMIGRSIVFSVREFGLKQIGVSSEKLQNRHQTTCRKFRNWRKKLQVSQNKQDIILKNL